MMMDVILPCFDIRHLLSVYSYTDKWNLLICFVHCFFLAFSHQDVNCASILSLQTHVDQSISEAFTCIHCYV